MPLAHSKRMVEMTLVQQIDIPLSETQVGVAQKHLSGAPGAKKEER